MDNATLFESLRGLPQCVDVPTQRIPGSHETRAVLNLLNGLTVVMSTHAEGLLGRGAETFRLHIARPAVASETDLRTVLGDRDAAKLLMSWRAQARDLALVEA